ncbi:hypothetical protein PHOOPHIGHTERS_45 [Serratia phage vB_SmaS_PhooPhighters]|nr:hypothetical protein PHOOPHIGHTERS_45 [Serratia phage vB_SmaS_PhooPhighters]
MIKMKKFTTRDESTGKVTKEHKDLSTLEAALMVDASDSEALIIQGMIVGAKVFFSGLSVERTA